MLEVGTFLADRYEIIAKVGAGGMSDVYKAKDHILGRFVAIKVLKQEYSEDRNFVTKFRIEAQSAAGLEHPNIVNIYDVGNADDLYFIVMEYVEGITLKTYIEKKGQLSFKEAESIAIQVARGIEAAHNKNIIHRDIKPQNIIISTEGKVKVTDFGIAKAASTNTISSDVMGSVHYVSPEQARNGFVDARSDIYSLGIVMYEMITGRVPFDGDTTVSVAIQHLQEEMTAPSVYAPNVPISCEKIILKCTQKNQDRRYQNIADLLTDLRKSISNPDLDFVEDVPLVDNGKTKVISEEDIRQIKDQSSVKESEPEMPVEKKVPLPEKVRIPKQEEMDEALEEEDEEDDEEGFINPKLDKGITILGIVMAIVILIVIIYLIGSVFGTFRFSNKKDKETQQTETKQTETESESETDSEEETETMVPMIKVVGMNEEDAKKNLEQIGLLMFVVEYQSSTEPDGTVLTQSVNEGQQVATGTTIEVVVAGAEAEDSSMVDVPNVVGRAENEAVNMLLSAGLNYQKSYEYNSSVAAGTVINQSPANGSVAKSTTVTIVISQGEQAIMVPSVIGKTQTDAQNTLANQNLKYNVTTDYSDSVAEGQIISQSVDAGKTVAPGTTVTIVVSLGKKTVYYKTSKTVYMDGATSATFVLTGNNGKIYASGTSAVDGAVTVTASDMTCDSGTLTVEWTKASEDEDGNISEETITKSYDVSFETQ